MIYLGNSPVGVASTVPEFFVADSGASSVTNTNEMDTYLASKISGWNTDKMALLLVKDDNARNYTMCSTFSKYLADKSMTNVYRYYNVTEGIYQGVGRGTNAVNMHEGAIYAVLRIPEEVTAHG